MGILKAVMPGARLLMVVTKKLIPPMSMATISRATARINKLGPENKALKKSGLVFK